MDNDFKTQLDLAHAIADIIDGLTFEFGPDAASHVAALQKLAIELMRQDPRYVAIADGVGRARIALRQQRVDVARKLQSNGVKENERTLNARMWTAGGYQRGLDNWISEFQQNEKLIEVGWWELVTTRRTAVRAEIKALCRTVTETNNARFESTFISDAEIHAAENAEREREHPTVNQYGWNSDFGPRGIRR
jgi:hypothetical protein